MKTRTLMLLALACGVAIMLAGAVFLFQLTQQDDVAEPTPIGESAEVADMSVTVVGSTESAGALVVSVRIGGVDDADGASGFRLIASGRPIEQIESGSEGETDTDGCRSTSVEVRACSVHFDVSSADGTSRVLFYERGEDRARWVLG